MVTRKIEKSLIEELERDNVLTLIGARQVGKTTLLKRLDEHLQSKNKTSSLYTLEDKYILSALNEPPERIFDYVDNDVKHQYLLIDEIQYLNDPTNFLKNIYDQYGSLLKIIVTGSSAFFLIKSIKTPLSAESILFI